MTETGNASWNLTSVSKGTYTLRVQNIMGWGQPKLKSITLNYDGEVPTAVVYTPDTKQTKKVLINQTIYIRQDDKCYTPDGKEVK